MSIVSLVIIKSYILIAKYNGGHEISITFEPVYRHYNQVKGQVNDPERVTATKMAAPVIPGGNAVGTAPWTKIMFDGNIMMIFFLKTLMIRKRYRPDILDMPRQVRRHH